MPLRNGPEITSRFEQGSAAVTEASPESMLTEPPYEGSSLAQRGGPPCQPFLDSMRRKPSVDQPERSGMSADAITDGRERASCVCLLFRRRLEPMTSTDRRSHRSSSPSQTTRLEIGFGLVIFALTAGAEPLDRSLARSPVITFTAAKA
jgi:hypothetical protein